ncbi:MAG: coenzyme F420-0:L-glutamate ligase [Halobacteria archaeon]
MTHLEDEVTAGVLDGVPLITPEEGIVEVLGEVMEGNANPDIQEIGLLVVASTVVSKAEGRITELSEYEVSDRARDIIGKIERDTGEKRDPRFVEAVLGESQELLIESPFLLSVTRFGHVAPNAGIDRSNIQGDGTVLLLPEDPSKSAEKISSSLGVPVVVTDTCGRPFRKGQRGVALGWSGFDAIDVWSGDQDLFGYELEVTEEAVADEIAAFANLLMGEAGDGTPAAYFIDVEGFLPENGKNEGDDEIFRERDDDLVREALADWSFR